MRKNIFLISLMSVLSISNLSAEDMAGKKIFKDKGVFMS